LSNLVAKNDEEIEPYAILWDMAFGTKNNLTWCCGNSTQGPQPVPVPVEGNFTEPFVLISVKEGGKISLRAISAIDDLYAFPLICVFDETFLDDCRSGKKTGLKSLFFWNATGEFNANALQVFLRYIYVNITSKSGHRTS